MGVSQLLRIKRKLRFFLDCSARRLYPCAQLTGCNKGVQKEEALLADFTIQQSPRYVAECKSIPEPKAQRPTRGGARCRSVQEASRGPEECPANHKKAERKAQKKKPK